MSWPEKPHHYLGLLLQGGYRDNAAGFIGYPGSVGLEAERRVTQARTVPNVRSRYNGQMRNLTLFL